MSINLTLVPFHASKKGRLGRAPTLKTSSQKRVNKTFFSFLAAAAFSFYGIHHFQDSLKGLLLDISRPLWAVASAPVDFLDPLIKSIKTFQDHHILLQNHQNLSKSYEKLSYDLKALELEARQLKRDLKVDETVLYGQVHAKVMAYLKTADQSTLVLNQGSKKGIKKNSFVVSQGSLVGIVKEVSLHACKVKTVEDPAFKISVTNARTLDRLIIGKKTDGSLGIIHQEHHKPYLSIFKQGDLLVTTGLMEEHLSGIAVSTIATIDEANMVLTPCVHLNSVDFVSIIEPLTPHS